MSLVCDFIYPYLVQVCINPIQLSTFRWRCSWTLELMNRRWSYPNVKLSSGFCRPSCFWGCLLFYSRIRRIHQLVEYVILVFFSSYFQILYWCRFGDSIFYTDIDYVFHLIILIIDGCCERSWVYVDCVVRVQNFSLWSLSKQKA